LEPIISTWAFRLVDFQLTVAGQRRIFTDFPQKETKATTKLRLQHESISKSFDQQQDSIAQGAIKKV
jgi:hypothetical protein